MSAFSTIRVFLSIWKQRVKQNIFVIEALLTILLVLGFAKLMLGMINEGVRLLAQVHRSTRLQSYRNLVEPFIRKHLKAVLEEHHGRMNDRCELLLGSRIMVLKKPGAGGERGVLYIMFNDVIDGLPEIFDMDRLLKCYYVVLEPSWAGYCHEGILQYQKYGHDVFVTCPEKEDYEFIVRMGGRLKPLSFGARDWVDPKLYECYRDPSGVKAFDIVMNSHWGLGKRHFVLFKSLKKLPNVTVALIGFPWEGRNLDGIKELAKYYKVDDRVTFFERIPYEEVIRVTSTCRIGVLLSLKEGGNRAIPECLFCDVPAIVLTRNIGGVKQLINPQTGAHTTDGKLAVEIRAMLGNLESYSPRAWALQNNSCIVTTSKLNSCLREHAVARGDPWTRDIVPRTNSPEGKYYNISDEVEYREENQKLKEYFRC